MKMMYTLLVSIVVTTTVGAFTIHNTYDKTNLMVASGSQVVVIKPKGKYRVPLTKAGQVPVYRQETVAKKGKKVDSRVEEYQYLGTLEPHDRSADVELNAASLENLLAAKSFKLADYHVN